MKSAAVSVGRYAGREEAESQKFFIIFIPERVLCLEFFSWENSLASLTPAAKGRGGQLQLRTHAVRLFSKRLPTKKVKSSTYCCPSGKYSFCYAGSQCFPSTLVHLQIFSSLQCSQSREKLKKKMIADQMQNVWQNNRNMFQNTKLIASFSNFLLVFIDYFLENKLIVLYVLSEYTFLGRLLQEL